MFGLIEALPIPAPLLDLVGVGPIGLNAGDDPTSPLPASLGHRRAQPKLLHRPRRQRPSSGVCLLRGGAWAKNRSGTADQGRSPQDRGEHCEVARAAAQGLAARFVGRRRAGRRFLRGTSCQRSSLADQATDFRVLVLCVINLNSRAARFCSTAVKSFTSSDIRCTSHAKPDTRRYVIQSQRSV